MRSFWCFISYRHADNRDLGRQWATWLHQAIETYEVPADLVGTQNERGVHVSTSFPEKFNQTFIGLKMPVPLFFPDRRQILRDSEGERYYTNVSQLKPER